MPSREEFYELNYRVSKEHLDSGSRVVLVSPSQEHAREYIAGLIARYPDLISEVHHIQILIPGEED